MTPAQIAARAIGQPQAAEAIERIVREWRAAAASGKVVKMKETGR